jgi:hypothetical protein
MKVCSAVLKVVTHGQADRHIAKVISIFLYFTVNKPKMPE